MRSLLHVAEKHSTAHKLLLQLICKTGGIRVSKIISVFQELCHASSVETEVPKQCTIEALCKALIKEINPVLSPMELKIAVATDYRFPDEQYLIMYSTASVTKFTKLFNPDELELFQKWFHQIFAESRNIGELDELKGINTPFDGNRMRPLHAEAFLKRLVADRILIKLDKYQSYIFSPKSIMELEPRLRNNYDIPPCPVCSNLVVLHRFANRCENCNSLIHNTCLQKMIKLSNTEVSCPGVARCPTKYNKATLKDLLFDTPIPEAINRPHEIKGETAAQSEDEEMEDDED